ncbi:MAG: TetR/AcrR family transcriptional regulator [Acidobacteria bacterium]|nr:TetR/AcrR family transcriptional regulator [Acidobacteriota bacterium]MBI3280543.1 TetR/AcrR family transcriptional regulator [Acidobacteriota bacterium]
MADPIPVRTRLSSPERRAAIVEAALRLFAEKGFRGTTTRELAAAVGVTEPILYEHFKTKRDLYSAIIETKACRGAEEAGRLLDQHQTSDDVAFFTTLGDTIAGWYLNDPAFVRLLLFSGLEGHELKEMFYERQVSQFFQFVSSYIERRIREGGMRRTDPMVAARAFFGMIAHYCLSTIVFNCPIVQAPKEEVIRGMVDIFLSGVCRGDAPGRAAP